MSDNTPNATKTDDSQVTAQDVATPAAAVAKLTQQQKDEKFVVVCEQVRLSDTPTIDQIVDSLAKNGITMTRSSVQQKRGILKKDGWPINELPKRTARVPATAAENAARGAELLAKAGLVQNDENEGEGEDEDENAAE